MRKGKDKGCNPRDPPLWDESSSEESSVLGATAKSAATCLPDSPKVEVEVEESEPDASSSEDSQDTFGKAESENPTAAGSRPMPPSEPASAPLREVRSGKTYCRWCWRQVSQHQKVKFILSGWIFNLDGWEILEGGSSCYSSNIKQS